MRKWRGQHPTALFLDFDKSFEILRKNRIKHINFQIGFQKDSVDEIIATRLQGYVEARLRIARHFVEANPTDPTHVMIVLAFQGFRVQVLEWFYTHLRVFSE